MAAPDDDPAEAPATARSDAVGPCSETLPHEAATPPDPAAEAGSVGVAVPVAVLAEPDPAPAPAVPVAPPVPVARAEAQTPAGEIGAAGVPAAGTYRKPSASPSARVNVETPISDSCHGPPARETKTAQ
jgi:hypothetical protein